MSNTDYIIDVSAENFNSHVVEASYSRPVMVDFWASWCGPCQALIPVVTKLAQEYQGQFILAKVNIDENQQLAAQFGVRSVPTVKLVKQGRVVDEFMGALPESSIRQFLDKHIERESDRQLEAALALYAQGEADQAIVQIQSAMQADPDNQRLPVQLLDILLKENRTPEAELLLENLPRELRSSDEIKGIETQLRFLSEAKGADLPALQKQVQDDPKDCAARHQLAALYIARGDYEHALEQLLEIIRLDRSYKDDVGRKDMLKVFDILGDKHALVSSYRQKMSRLLY